MSAQTFAEIHFTGEGFRTVSIYRHFFKAALREVRARIAAYEDEVREWYEEGEGRDPEWVTLDDGSHRQVNIGGKGHTFPTCIHGASLWTDYDNICGWCEDSSTVVDIARVEARTNFLRFVEHFEWVSRTPNTVPHEILSSLQQITITLFPRLDTVSGD